MLAEFRLLKAPGSPSVEQDAISLSQKLEYHENIVTRDRIYVGL